MPDKQNGGAMTDYDALSERELDALVAEKVMGWEQVTEHSVHGMWTGIPPGKVGFNHILPFCSDDNAARLVRNRINELGLEGEWVQRMDSYLALSRLANNWDVAIWLYQQATPRQQMIAALKAKESSNG